MTPKQEAFCHAYIETGNASEAYRRAYNAGRMKPETIWVKACELLKEDKVAVRVAELKEAVAEKHEVTVESITKELDLAYKAAAKFKQSGGMVSALQLKAKLYGLITDKSVVDQTTRYVARMPDVIDDEDEWLTKHAPAGKSKSNGSTTVQ